MSGRRIAVALLASAAIATALLAGFTPNFPSWAETAAAVAGGILAALSGFIALPPTRKKKKKKKTKKKSEHQRRGSGDGAALRAIKNVLKTGLLAFDIPSSMKQGQQEIIHVSVARSTDLRASLASELQGRDVAQVEEIPTSLYMEVSLTGPTFDIIPHSPAEQLIIPEPARWEFEVTPCQAGSRQITLRVAMRIEADGIKGGRRSVSSVERIIAVRVNYSYAVRRFVVANWQWLIPTVVALAGSIAAWLVVPF